MTGKSSDRDRSNMTGESTVRSIVTGGSRRTDKSVENGK